MKSFHVKSILLGIGMGIVLTAFISMIYVAGYQGEKMNNEQIIAKAKELGLVEPQPIINDKDDTSDTKLNDNNSKPEDNTTQTSNTEPAQSETVKPEPPQDITISVVRGDTTEKVAAKLLAAGLITDKAVFLKQITDMRLAGEINIGAYKIKKGTDIKTIIRTITGKT